MMTPTDVTQQLGWRYATKQFDPARAIPDEHWTALENALVTSPSSFGLQPWKFVVVDDPELRGQLRTASWNQSQITDAARLVVFLGKRTIETTDIDRFLNRTAEVRGTPIESLDGYRKMLVGFVKNGWAAKDLAGWNARQVYIALGQFMTTAAMLGVDTCPMEGIDMARYDELLGLEGSDYTTLVACTAGYRHADDKYGNAPKVRYAADELIERR
ncbi:MAG: NAD(P)H-dependent oxidoreductase [bacterium]|nr:NAD(P)H-dependent oxidoreductase [bacterium]